MISDEDEFDVFSFDDLISPEEISNDENGIRNLVDETRDDFMTEIRNKEKEISRYIKQHLNRNSPQNNSFKDQRAVSPFKGQFESGQASDVLIYFVTSVQDQVLSRQRCVVINERIAENESEVMNSLLANFQVKGYILSHESVKRSSIPFKRTMYIDQNDGNKLVRIQNIKGLDILLDLQNKKFIVPRNYRNNPYTSQVNLYFLLITEKNSNNRRSIKSLQLRNNCEQVLERMRRTVV